MINNLLKLLVLAAISSTVLSACTQWPTEKRSTVDTRPGISFKAPNDAMLDASVKVDGLDVGIARNYKDGEVALRVLPGPHVISIYLDNKKIIEEKIYAGDGINQTFVIR